MLARIAREYDRGYGHFTTRQNIQYNWPKLETVPDILELLASVQMHAIQTSGNCIRNVTADHLAGVAPDELEDPRPWCEYIRQWATLHPEFSYLPRKFKIAVTGSPQDRAASKVHDIGLHLVRNAQGEVGFEVLVGGGLGRTPMIGHVIREFLPKQDLLGYLEAILRVYNLEGRRDNIHKARIKILVKAVGPQKFREMVEAEWQASRDTAPVYDAAEVERIKAFFTPPNYETLHGRGRGVGQADRIPQLVSAQHEAPQGGGLSRRVRVAEVADASAGRHHRRGDGRASPISPISIRSASCARRTIRTCCSPTCVSAICSRCGRRSRRSTWRRRTSARSPT